MKMAGVQGSFFYDTVCAKRFSALRRTLTGWRSEGGVAPLPYLF